ncbi:galactokinase family protein [Pseudodesulfovibrio sp.]|uniref:galactokinase n=1 Tax=Pseudodesulfovibrio sp. TaxID=2035812 RepID=UPI002639CD6E|nr:galactokinase family protein [Pseudodesulfovibrio sp.]MDD3313058.1 galactokinase family protein [Pseudodesulfovibrio sp.]
MRETVTAFSRHLEDGGLDALLAEFYGEEALPVQRQRYQALLHRMERCELAGRAVLVSVPGRTELGGNHTDHNHGVVLAAGVHFDCLALAVSVDEPRIRVRSEGFADEIEVSLDDLEPRPEERERPVALVRGVAHALRAAGYAVGGFDACVSGGVPMGVGLSSSAAFEVCLGRILSELRNGGRIDPVTLARCGQAAENIHFGKPCGLMDQLACACQGVVSIDFADPGNPAVRNVDFDFEGSGYRLAVVDTGGSHADLTPDYAAIPEEMRRAARVLGREYARGLTVDDVLAAAPRLRREAGDRAVLRLLHFIEESDRAAAEAEALDRGDMAGFLDLVRASGDSSWRLLQNCFSPSQPLAQPIPLALTLSERFLGGDGAWRIQGGGFAGTIQAYVPADRFEAYRAFMEGVFGPRSVLPLHIRRPGREVVFRRDAREGG